MPELNAKERARLKKVADATKSDTGFMYGGMKEYQTLADAGLIEVNEEDKNDKGEIAIRASDEGMAAIYPTETAPAADTSADTSGEGDESDEDGDDSEAASAFAIDDDVPMPKIKRRSSGERESKYPFDKLEIGQSFHVPATEKMPDPVKSLASSVTTANRRYSEEIPGQTRKTKRNTIIPDYKLTRKFVVRPAAENDPRGAGARVFRVELPSEGEAHDAGDEDNGGENGATE